MLRLILCTVVLFNIFIVFCEADSAIVQASDSSASISYSRASRSHKKCRKVPRCPVNEEYSKHPNLIVRPLHCSEKDRTYRVPVTGDNTKGACVCKTNYLRAQNGTCIPEDQCELICGPDEVLNNCPRECDSDYCPTSNDKVDCPFLDDGQCPPPACKCGFNRRRAPNGSCISVRDCPPFDCSAEPNEEYVACPPLCPTDDCSQASPTGKCPLFGVIGIILPCNPTCRCIEGYWRLNGTCVPYAQCPNVCPENEEYVSCKLGVCRAMNCSQTDVPCPDLLPGQPCDGGCICKENFLRDKNGKCVPADQCEVKTCGENEELRDCPPTCTSDYCPQCADEEQTCVQQETCEPDCRCKFNHRRAENGTCIPTTDCPPFDCSERPNEVYNPCPALCPSDECSLPWVRKRCPFNIKIRLNCNPKCQCEDGYGRVDGVCVPFEECPNLCPANEEYSPCVEGDCRPQNCEDRDNVIDICPLVDEASCTKGCVCKSDYYRNDKGQCVSYEECGVDKGCGRNEERRCVQSCPPQKTCRNRNIQFACLQSLEPCQNKCVCKKGYFKNAVGDCITEEQCNKCSGANEYFACGSACDNVCSSLSKQNKTNCPIINIKCNEMCYCEDGYARDAKGVCVPIDKCNPPPCTGQNEEYTDCKRTCPPELCSSLGRQYKCASNKTCQAGCACKSGYLRKEEGSPCIPKSQCP